MAAEYTLAIVVVLISMGLALAFSIGANDETLAALVGAGVIKLRYALILGGAAVALGMILFSHGVGKTVGADILGPGLKYSLWMLFAVLISSIVWLIIGSFAGIPLSSTHSTVGSIFGVVIIYSIMKGGIDPATAFNWIKWRDGALGWFISPIMGLFFTYLLFLIISKLYLSKLKGLDKIEKSERNFAGLLFLAVIFAEIWVGANSAECIGIFYGMLDNGTLTLQEYWVFVVLSGVFVFLGIYIAGRFVIKNLASQMTDARPSEGFIVQISSAIILMIATFMGLPISHSHVIVFCIIGLNMGMKKEVDYKGIGKMGLFWVLTFPVAALLAGFIYYGFMVFGFY
ncbi:MAG: inorganic phosphate transporter [Promethearchaeota archaeon]|nr:MAG: inorganic phosphate transporter [Candidatus Lokiarchaeota archaeon]